MEKIKVILACPQVIFREGIHFILSGEEDFEVSGETTGNKEAYELIEANPPNIVLLSQADKKADYAEITRRIRLTYPSVLVILIADKNAGEALFPAIVSGVSASLTPDTDPELMVAVIREVAQGRLPAVNALFTPAVAARALADFQDLATLNERLGISMAQLSRRETEILSSIVSGSAPGQIAAKLNIAEDSVRDTMRAVLQKLVANDRNRAIIEKTQVNLPVLVHGMLKGNSVTSEYLTRTEFNEFKDSLLAGFKSLITEKS
jgi:DNA-binding NarL/FixJ family response regulator